MANESVAKEPGIEIDKNEDIGFRGMLNLLTRHTYVSGPSYSSLGMLSNQELATIRNQASNIRAAGVAGLSALGALVSAYDETSGGFDFNGTGWLIQHLAEEMEAVQCIESDADMELVRRGYDGTGQLLPLNAGHTKDQAAA